MISQGRFFTTVAACGTLLIAAVASAQQGSTAGGSLTGRGTGAAGRALSLSTTQGYGLDSRFTGSGFNRFTQGSTAMGTVTAGDRGKRRIRPDWDGHNRHEPHGKLRRHGRHGKSRRHDGHGHDGHGPEHVRYEPADGHEQPEGDSHAHRPGIHPTCGGERSGHVASYQKIIARVLERGDYGSGNVSLTMEGGVAILSGTVESDHARGLAGRLALLEPGIAAVRNELIVRAAEPTRAP